MVQLLNAYMDFHKDAEKTAASAGKIDEEIFAETIQGAIYRLYLLGVEDGMKAAQGGMTENG